MEGPQTRALADELNDRLGGQKVERLDLREDRWQANVLLLNCAGQVIQRVHAHGKWLFFDFSHGVTWVCHLLGRSAWQFERRADRTGAAPLITIVLRSGVSAVLLGRPLFLIMPTELVRRHADLSSLGPDPLDTAFQAEEFLVRLRRASGRSVAGALVDQEVVAGLGNQMKCEVLHAAGLAPPTRISELYASQLDRLAAALLATSQRAYLHFAGQSPQEPLWRVYDRAGDACLTCGAAILVDHSAGDGRWTWYCPTCQALGRPPTLFD